MAAAGADEGLRAHCRAVAESADGLCAALRERGVSLDTEAVHAAALLHDLARSEKDHAAVGALWLRELGYPELAELVRQHHDPDGTDVNEAALVFLADKTVSRCIPDPIWRKIPWPNSPPPPFSRRSFKPRWRKCCIRA